MNEFKRNLLKLYLDHPFDYNLYLDGYKNKDYAFRVIKSFIPTHTGIEWEIGPNMVNELFKDGRTCRWMPKLCKDSSFEVTYMMEIDNLNERLHRLNRMYEYMNKPYRESKRETNSGIHIHTNLIHGLSETAQMKLIRDNNWTARKAVKIIAREFFHYAGTYNELKFDWSKGNAIIYRRNYNTIEYRCINMTWSFRELLKYIIACHLLTNLFIQYGNDKIDAIGFMEKISDYVRSIHQL